MTESRLWQLKLGVSLDFSQVVVYQTNKVHAESEFVVTTPTPHGHLDPAFPYGGQPSAIVLLLLPIPNAFINYIPTSQS